MENLWTAGEKRQDVIRWRPHDREAAGYSIPARVAVTDHADKA